MSGAQHFFTLGGNGFKFSASFKLGIYRATLAHVTLKELTVTLFCLNSSCVLLIMLVNPLSCSCSPYFMVIIIGWT